MKRSLFTVVLLSILTLLLTGCFTKTQVVRDTQYVRQTIPSQLTTAIPEIQLIPRDQYALLDEKGKEAYLIEKLMESIAGLRMCNVRLEEIEKLNED